MATSIVNLYNLVAQAVNDWANNTTDVMLKSEYDTNTDGTVNDSTNLNGQAASYYLDRANMTGTQLHSTISDYDTEIAGKANVTAYTPTADYHPATKKYIDDAIIAAGAGDMTKSVYDTTSNGIVDDSEKLGTQLPAYYLDWTNFTGTPTTLAGYGITDAATIVSPTFTGIPAAPTATTGTNTTQLATTAFVQQELTAVTEW